MGEIRVAHIIARMNVGGPAVEISELVRGLGARGIDQVVLTGDCYPGEADYLAEQAADVPAIRIRGLGSGGFGSAPSALARLVHRIRSLRPTIIHTHTAKAGLFGRQAAQLARFDGSLVHTFHGHVLHGYFSPRRSSAWARVEASLARRTNALVAVGETVRDDLVDAGIGVPRQFRVIRSAVPPIEGVPRADARASLGVGDDDFVVLWLGRLVQIKRPDRFLEACEQVAQALPRARFLVAGGGDKDGLVRNHPLTRSGQLQALGWRSDLGRLLGAADVLVLTSDNEGAPLSLIEAGMAGVPVVATPVGSVPEIVTDGVTGLLAKPNPREIASAILSLAADEALRCRLGRAAAVEIPRRYSRDVFLGEHEALYRDLARCGSPEPGANSG